MNIPLDFSKSAVTGCVLQNVSGNSARVLSEAKGGAIVFTTSGLLSGADLRQAEFLNFDITYEGDSSMCLAVDFLREDGDGPFWMTIGLLPGIKTKISLPFAAMDSQNVFFKRTPGKLKTTMGGKPMKMSELKAVSLRVDRIAKPSAVVIENLCISGAEQDYAIPDVKLADGMGQAIAKEWPDKMKGADELVTYLRAELAEAEKAPETRPGYDEYGGWLKKSFEATGYFRTVRENGKWWLADPLGNAFFSMGVDCVRPGDGEPVAGIEGFHEWLPGKDGEFADAWNDGFNEGTVVFNTANMIRAFGGDWFSCWAKMTAARLKKWGINTVANWSDLKFIKSAKMPYVWPLKDFPATKNMIFRDFPDVFSEEYRENSAIFAKQVEPFAGDPYMIGYFLSNEPIWAFGEDLNIAEEMLAAEGCCSTKDEFIRRMDEKYGNIAALNEAWNTAFASFADLKKPLKNARKLSVAAAKDVSDFSVAMTAEYVAAPSKALRAVDPNHLNLGIRYAWLSSEALLGGVENFDVFSFNCYTNDPTGQLADFAGLNMPVMIGEYHWGALDAGLWSTGLGAAASQKERGNAYRFYTERAAAVSHCVGAHYFQYNDQPLLGRFDGENYNIGFVDVCGRPHADFIAGVAATAADVYEVADGKKEAYSVTPEYAEKIFF